VQQIAARWAAEPQSLSAVGALAAAEVVPAQARSTGVRGLNSSYVQVSSSSALAVGERPQVAVAAVSPPAGFVAGQPVTDPQHRRRTAAPVREARRLRRLRALHRL